jgi:sortase A
MAEATVGWGRASRVLERALLGVGAVLLVFWVVARIHGEVGRRAELRRFAEDRSAPLSVPTAVDDHLWSPKRVLAYRETLKRKFAPTLAVLRVPRAGIEVPVLPGTDDATLNRGVGWIEGTARPGERGNVGIAGHRDGFFRGLKDIAPGDAVTLETLSGREDYVIDDVRIVSPAEVSVLEPTGVQALTLVTCYPFYFVGDAPQRFIVRALRRDTGTRQASFLPSGGGS